jgi:hypothetical protein
MAVTKFSTNSITTNQKTNRSNYAAELQNISFLTEATGGSLSTTIENGITYKVHEFTSSGTFGITSIGSNSTIEYFLLAGGGGAGGGSFQGGAGGGAGGLIISSFTGAIQNYTITVGGAGTNSVISGITTANAGGSGGSWGGAGSPGGSGGGDGGAGGCSTGAGTAGQGNNGGCGATGSEFDPGGGGGGKGGVGGNAGGSVGGAGGAGLTSAFNGVSTLYAKGGGGRSNNSGGGPNQGFGASYAGTGAGSGKVMLRYVI